MPEWIAHDWISQKEIFQGKKCSRLEFDLFEYGGRVLAAHDAEKVDSETLQLSEALTLLKQTELPLMCDLKSYNSGFLTKVAQAFSEMKWQEPIIFSSHLAQDSRWVARRVNNALSSWSIPQVDLSGVNVPVPNSHQELMWQKENIHKRVVPMLRFDMCDILAVQFELATPEMVEGVHDGGKKILAWTADQPETVKQLEALGVDGIITNNPDLIPGA